MPLTAGPDKSSVLLIRPTFESPKSVNCSEEIKDLLVRDQVRKCLTRIVCACQLKPDLQVRSLVDAHTLHSARRTKKKRNLLP